MRRSIPRRRRRFTMLGAGLLVLAAAPAAQGRVLLVATGTPELPLVEVSTDRVVARVALPGPVTAVAASPFGGKGYAASGTTVIELDIDRRVEERRVTVPGAPISQLATARDGRIYALQGQELSVIDPTSLARTAVIALPLLGQTFAIGSDGTRAAVALFKDRVAVLSLPERRVLRTVRLPGVRGVAVDGGGRVLATARGHLRTIEPGARKPVKSKLRLPLGVGGALARSPRDARLAVGAVDGRSGGAIVNLTTRTVRRLVTGPGPGTPAWNIDATRLFYADLRGGSISVVGSANRRRLDVVGLTGSTPFAVVEQPGLALLPGTEAADTLTGTGGPDRMEGMGGNDYLRGGRGRDVVNGGLGDDRLSGGALSDIIAGDEGNDFLTGLGGDDRMTTGPGEDGADGGTGNDTIEGGLGNDNLDGGDGDDTIMGGEGNDRIVEKGFGNDKRLNGGPGDDTISGGRGSDRIIEGEDGNDKLSGGPGKETMSGGQGNDVVDGGRAADVLSGDEGNDELKGDAAGDTLDGGEGIDRLDGGSGEDKLDGGDDGDTLVGGPGVDAIQAGAGNDTIRAADDSADLVDCGSGSDTVFVEADFPMRDQLRDCEVVEPIPPEAANDTEPPSLFFGSIQNETIRGTPGEDSILGNGGRDKLFGLGGNDYVDGGNGDDELHGDGGDDIMAGRGADDEIFGDDGDDRITGDRGRDVIDGGAGKDTIFGNLDPDQIAGGAGDDRINVVGGGTDVVRCGSGNDRVFADARDRVASDCERISR